ncbi:MAG TPA: TonB-dependent receptor [Bacteroidales bacterium]|nr:TonB-dependent receptor [Bacteroidales bacterium]HQG53851.1 TonB-dependent receptor [Bacteroidales bacterium]
MKRETNQLVLFLLSLRKFFQDIRLKFLICLLGAVSIFYSANAQGSDAGFSLKRDFNDLYAYATKNIKMSLPAVFNKNVTILSDEQQITVTGKVTDSQTGEPMVGVNVVVKGTNIGTMTDASGNYSLNVPDRNATLVFSFIGYTTQEIPLEGKTTLNVALVSETIGLEEIVVVGYGTQQKRTISGSIATVSEKNFNTGVTRTAADLLQGKVAGLLITSYTGDVTSQQTMRLRGTSSLTGSSEPFVVIDGVPGLSLNAVAPQDIESISILKDASSAAIYGSRSASGVILITTKKGKSGQFATDYNGYFAVDVVSNKPDVLTADEWRKACADLNLAYQGFDKGANTDWFGEIMRTGISQNHDLSFSGGGSSNNYRVSFSYLDQEGVVKDNYQTRMNLRFSANQKALNNKLNLTLIGTITQRDYQPSDTRNFVLAYNMLPVYPVKNEDGTWFDSTDYDQGNPVRNITYNYNKYKTNLNYINLKADLEIIKNLNLSLNAYFQRQTTDRSRYYNSLTERGRTEYGSAYRYFSSGNTSLIESTINYSVKLGSHDINVLGGISFEDNYSQSATAQNRKFVTDLFGANNLSAGENMQVGDVASNASMNRLESYFGRVNYIFLNRYIVSATLRRDGSSKFGKNNKWGTFPSASVAWRISEEPFMQGLSGIFDDLKLRAGYGISGNQEGLAPYQSMQLYGSSGTYYDNGTWHTAYAVSQNANPNLQWEETAMTNIGIDFSIFNSRLSGTIEYYDKNTSKLLYTYPVPVPPYLYSSMVANVGSMKNNGVEVALSGDIIRTNNIRWTLNVNASHNKNEITKLSSEEFTTPSIKVGSAWVRGGSSNTTHIVEEGRPVGQFYGWECLGIDENGLYIINDMVDGVPGVTISDYTYIGNAQPKLTYGIDNSIIYKNFEFSFFFRGVYGNDVLNFSKLSYATTQWLPGANVLHDALTIGLKQSPFYNSFYIEKGSFCRLENINLAYSFNPRILGINRLRVYFTGKNLLLLTKYKGVDPEVPMSGLDPGVEGREYYPKSRTYLFGINLNF